MIFWKREFTVLVYILLAIMFTTFFASSGKLSFASLKLCFIATHLLEHFPCPPLNVDNNDLLHDQNWFTQLRGIESSRFRQVSCDIERSVPIQCNRNCSFRFQTVISAKKKTFIISWLIPGDKIQKSMRVHKTSDLLRAHYSR